MAGDEVAFSLVQEKGFFGLALSFGVGAPWLEQASLIQSRGTMFLFEETFLPFLRRIQFRNGLEQKLCIGV